MKKSEIVLIFLKFEKLVFLFLGVLLLFLTWSFLIPKTSKIFEARKSLDAEKVRLQKLQAKLDVLESLNDFELTERTNTVLKAMPDKKNFVAVMILLRTQATEKGLALNNLKVAPGNLSEEEQTGDLGKIDFKFDIQGPNEVVLDFFSTLQKSLPLVSLKKVGLSLSEGNMAATLSLESYFLALPETLGAIDSSLPLLTVDEEKILSQITQFIYVPPAIFAPATGRANPFSF